MAVLNAIGGRAQGLAVHTSGTTGMPREVYLSTAALRLSGMATHQRLQGAGRWLLTTPADRIAGAMVMVRSFLAGAAPGRMTPGHFSAEGFAHATETMMNDSPRYVSLVPTQLRRVLASPAGREALEQYDTVLVGGSTLLDSRVPANVVTSYGMTETCGGCVYDGVPLKGVLTDVDEDGRILLSGTMLADGYSDGDDDAWLRRDGHRWLRTPDAGEHRAGRLLVFGRLDDVIISGGHKIHPLNVERAVFDIPGVADVVVAPAPDPEWGQRVVAVIEPTAGAGLLTVEEVREAIGDALPRYALPHEVRTIAAMPRLSSGKIDRRSVQRTLID
jgi:O-succinylbenzoic acid--CoA ligase